MLDYIKSDWAQYLNEEFEKEYFRSLLSFLKAEYENNEIYPKQEHVFHALNLTSFEKTKVVILGQDPYHGPGQAHGLSFSVQPGTPLPPSLKNIFKELQADLGYNIPISGSLIPWAKQGVLLLNTVLTVRKDEAHSHKGKGWEIFTDKIIQLLNNKKEPVVYILWGNAAQKKESIIDTSKHFILKSVHPSPLSVHRGFFGSKPFSKTNEILHNQGLKEIDWQLK